MGIDMEMPKYKCHKEVYALKISEIHLDEVLAGGGVDGMAEIVPVEEGYAAFEVDSVYLRKHNPKVGGYYVVYKDGYKSYSPAKAFENGYTLIE